MERPKNTWIRRFQIRILIRNTAQNSFFFQQREPDDQLAAESFVPGTGRVYVKTWGCAHNSSDSEYMAGQLAAEVNRILVRFFCITVGTLLRMRIINAILIK